ncbi:hypothetical protein [Mesobacillus sp. S13]|uniref:hypothetical protein n=1 Tax=Mesobacillus sp. S13 TaxID=2880221 RepID=UPI001CF144F9|nr:hypothetical protein [Mesobacillus sp. S13]
MSVIRAMTDKNRRISSKSVRHQGDDGQKQVERQQKMSVIEGMTNKNRWNESKNVRHQNL